jgi:transposase
MIGKTVFIYCADAGLGSYNIRQFNSMGGRAFIVTQSIKKLSAVLREAVFNDCDYRLLSNDKEISVEFMKTFDRFDPDNLSLYNDHAYKVICADKAVDLGLLEEKQYKNGNTRMVKSKGNLRQRVIVTFSRKMMEYQRAVRKRQVERAEKLLKSNDPEEIKKGPNDVRRFMKRIASAKDGQEVSVTYVLDDEKIKEEEKYDGYYAVATNLEDPAKDILAISHKRYQIEDCFRILKTNFSARPVYHKKGDRIKCHFLICYTALLIYRLIEVQLRKNNTPHTIRELQETMKNMNVIDEFNAYYRALYTGSTTLTDMTALTGLPLDHEYYQARDLRKMIKKLSR